MINDDQSTRRSNRTFIGLTRGDDHHSRISVCRPVVDYFVRPMLAIIDTIRRLPKALMSPLKSFCILFFMGFATQATAQDIPVTLIEVLDDQGYEITSTRYTWLGRIYVEATDGTNERSILITRASGKILQDDVAALHRTRDAAPEGHDENGHPSPPDKDRPKPEKDDERPEKDDRGKRP